MAASSQALGSFNVLTRSYDNQRSGTNTSETSLKPASVSATKFGRLFQLPVDDQVYAQMLYASSVTISGAAHNVLYVATVNNSVYAFDADTAGAPLWQRNYNGSGRAPRNNEVANGTACGGNYKDYSGNIGIVSTPVIDGSSSTMYFVTRTLEGSLIVYRLHAIDIATANERAGSPVVIQGSVAGTGAGSVGGQIAFDPMFHNQRAGLALGNNAVYVAFASYCDAPPYHGWMMAYDTTSLARVGIFNASPNGSHAGIWQGGAAPMLDSAGYVYVTTGNALRNNGDWDGTANFPESVLKLAPRTLNRVDYFTPSNYADLNDADDDFGSAGPTFVPGTNRLVNGSKRGLVYLLDASNLGHMVTGDTQVPDILPAVDHAARPEASHHIHGQTVAWASPAGINLYVWGENDYLRAFRYNATTQKFDHTAFAVGGNLPPWGMPGGAISLSSNAAQSNTGVLWATTPSQGDANQAVVPGILRAYNAENLSLLWESSSPGDDILEFSKFNPPVVAKGKVYVASFSGAISVFGARTGPTPPLVNSIYQLRPRTTSGKCASVAGNSNTDGALIQQNTCSGNNWQRIQVTNVSNNVYELRLVGSNKCLAVVGSSTAEGTNVEQRTCNNSNAQRWAISALGNAQYRITTQLAGNKCLTVNGSSPANGVSFQERSCTGESGQIFNWAFDTTGNAPIPNSAYRIVTGTGPDECVDVDNGSGDDGANVWQYGCNGSDAQRWRFKNLGTNLYEVRAAVSDKCLDVQFSGTANGTDVWQYACNQTLAQTWSVQSLGNARYRFMPQVAANECLHVNGSTGDGVDIVEWACNGTASQSFGVLAP